MGALRPQPPNQGGDRPGPALAENTGYSNKSTCPHYLGRTQKRLPLRFWPSRFQRPARMRSIRGKPGIIPRGKLAFPLGFSRFSWGQKPLTVRNPTKQPEQILFVCSRDFGKCGSRGLRPLVRVWGAEPQRSLYILFQHLHQVLCIRRAANGFAPDIHAEKRR